MVLVYTHSQQYSQNKQYILSTSLRQPLTNRLNIFKTNVIRSHLSHTNTQVILLLPKLHISHQELKSQHSKTLNKMGCVTRLYSNNTIIRHGATARRRKQCQRRLVSFLLRGLTLKETGCLLWRWSYFERNRMLWCRFCALHMGGGACSWTR